MRVSELFSGEAGSVALLRVFKAAAGALILVTSICCAVSASGQGLDSNLWVTDGPVSALASDGKNIYIGGFFTRIGPAIGGWALFDTTGAAVPPYGLVAGTVFASASDGSGGWYIGGLFTAVRGQPRNNLAHLDASGALTPWNPGTDGEVRAMLQNGGVIYVGGYFTTLGGQSRNNLGAVDTSGATTSWNPGADATVMALTADGSGTIYAGGAFSTVGGQARHCIAAVDASGAVTSWNPNANEEVDALGVFVQTHFPFATTIYAGGFFNIIGGQTRNRIAAIDATGSATAWNPNSDGYVYAITVRPNGTSASIYAGGRFNNIGGQQRTNLALIDPSGTAATWTSAEDLSYLTVRSIAIDPRSATIVYVGGDLNGFGTAGKLLALDATTGMRKIWPFDPTGTAIYTIRTSANGAIYAGGDFTSAGGWQRGSLAAFDAQSGAVTSWNPVVDFGKGSISCLALSGGRLFVGGSFATIGNEYRNNLACLDSTGTPTPWNPGTDDPVYGLAVRDNTVYIGGSFVRAGNQGRNYLAALDATTGVPTIWNPNPNGTVRALALVGNVVYAGGGFTIVGSQVRNYLAAIDATNGVPTPWDPNPDSDVMSLLPGGGTVIVGGDFHHIGGQPRNFIASVDSAGAASAWDPNANDYVTSLALDNGTVYAGGNFTAIGGQQRSHFAALDPLGNSDSGWNPGASSVVSTILVSGGTVYAGGSFSSISLLPHSGIASLSPSLVGVDEPVLRGAPRILRLFPNPSRSAVSLDVALPEAAHTTIAVYDPAGRLVRRLQDGPLPAGQMRVLWDGRSDRGAAVGAGLYFIEMRAGGRELITKLVRVR